MIPETGPPLASADPPRAPALQTFALYSVIASLAVCALVTAFRAATASEAAGQGGTAVSNGDNGLLIGWLVLSALLPLTAAWSSERRYFGVGLPAPRPVLHCIRATVLVFTTQWVVGAVAMQFSDHGRLQESLDDAFESRTTTHTVLMAVEAAVGEEARDILMPTVTVVLLLALINGRGRLTRHVGAGVRTASSWRWRVGIACLAGLAIRINDHLYQGAVFATAAAVWGAALLAIYLVYRSVIPLIMGHFIFDLLIGSSQWSSATTTWTLVLGGLAVAITYVLECRASRELGGSRVHETC